MARDQRRRPRSHLRHERHAPDREPEVAVRQRARSVLAERRDARRRGQRRRRVVDRRLDGSLVAAGARLYRARMGAGWRDAVPRRRHGDSRRVRRRRPRSLDGSECRNADQPHRRFAGRQACGGRLVRRRPASSFDRRRNRRRIACGYRRVRRKNDGGAARRLAGASRNDRSARLYRRRNETRECGGRRNHQTVGRRASQGAVDEHLRHVDKFARSRKRAHARRGLRLEHPPSGARERDATAETGRTRRGRRCARARTRRRVSLERRRRWNAQTLGSAPPQCRRNLRCDRRRGADARRSTARLRTRRQRHRRTRPRHRSANRDRQRQRPARNARQLLVLGRFARDFRRRPVAGQRRLRDLGFDRAGDGGRP